MTDIKWQDPPAASRPSSNEMAKHYDEVARILHERPGEWALVSEGYVRPETMIEAGRYDTPACKALRRRGLRVRARSMSDGTLSTWASAP